MVGQLTGNNQPTQQQAPTQQCVQAQQPVQTRPSAQAQQSAQTQNTPRVAYLKQADHNPEVPKTLDMRQGVAKECCDVMLGRIEWRLQHELCSTTSNGKKDPLNTSIEHLGSTRDRISTAGAALHSGEFALVEKALRHASTVSVNHATSKVAGYMATFIAAQWVDAKTEQISAKVEQDFVHLKDDGARQTQSKLYGGGVDGLVGPFSGGGRVAGGTLKEDSVDHNGSHVHKALHQGALKARAKVAGGAYIFGANANVSMEGRVGINTGESKVYKGGSSQYIREEGYKSTSGSKALDAKLAEKLGGLSTSPSEFEEASQTQRHPESLWKKAKAKIKYAAVTNDLKSAAKIKQLANNEQQILAAMMLSELGLTVQLPLPKVKPGERTRLQGMELTGIAKIKGEAGIVLPGTQYGANIDARATLSYTMIDNSYVMQQTMWDAFKAADASSTVSLQRGQALLQKTNVYVAAAVASNANLSLTGNSLATATTHELMAFLKQLGDDVSQVTSTQRILLRRDTDLNINPLATAQLNAIKESYGFNKKSSADDVMVVAAQIHAAIGSQLMFRQQLDSDKEQLMDDIAVKLRNPDIVSNPSQVFDKTTFSSKADIKSTSDSKDIEMSGLFGVPGLKQAAELAGKNVVQRAKVTVTTTKISEHPDPLSRGETKDVSFTLPAMVKTDSLDWVVDQLKDTLGLPSLDLGVLEQAVRNARSSSDIDKPLTITMRFSRPSLDTDSQESLQLEYVAVSANKAYKDTDQEFAGNVKQGLGIVKGVAKAGVSAVSTATGGAIAVKGTYTNESHTWVPIATAYGEGSLKNVIKAFNSTHASSEAEPDNSDWQQQKLKRQEGIDKILVSLADSGPNRTIIETLFSDVKREALPQDRAAIVDQRDAFFALAEKLKMAYDDTNTHADDDAGSADDPEDLLQQLNTSFENILLLQNISWQKIIKSSMEPIDYK